MRPLEPRDDLPMEILAAYVDGELNSATRARVESWLAEHPEAHSELFEQREMSLANQELWDAAGPPMPSAARWDRTYSEIERRLVNPVMPVRARRRTVTYLAPVFALTGIVAVLLVVVSMIAYTPGPHLVKSFTGPAAQAFDDDDEGIYRIATADDVEIIQLPEEASSLIVVGRHPMDDTPLVLATTSDLDIFNLGPDDQGHMPNVELIAGPNAPMLVAQTPRR
jgi:anti-sigma factor RsiW